MSVDFSNVQVGDRIKLTRENGDEFSFTVKSSDPQGHGWADSARDRHFRSEWDTLEILEKALPEAPTRYGAMVHSGDKFHTYYVLDSTGVWRSDGGDATPTQRIRENLRDGWKVVFEGLDYDA